MAVPSSPRTASQRRLWTTVGIGALVVLCLCLVVGVGGGVALYLFRNQPVSAAAAAVEYILDASPRMALPGETGEPRLTVARGVLADVVRPADPSVLAGLRVFGTGASTGTCQDTNLLVPIAGKSQQLISQKAAQLEAGQSTDSALAQAVVAAIRDLAANQGAHSLVVVTGGADSCNPEAGQVIAQEAKRSGIDLDTYVIGFGVSDTEAQAIKVVFDQAPKARILGAKNKAELELTLRGVQDRIDHPAAKYTGQSACDYPYYPLRKGASWEYSMSGETVKETITAVSGDQNNAVATEDFSNGPVSATFDISCGLDGIASFDIAAMQLSSAQIANAQMKMTSHTGPILVPPSQLAPGSTWQANYTMEISMALAGQSLTLTDEVTQQFTSAGVESVTTPAGTFDAIRVDSTSTVKMTGMPAIAGGAAPSEMTSTMTQWYARGVGLVKMVTGGQSSMTQELTKYNIP
jgi:hypothetical protein